jgi:S-adenosyl-L-methionine hydrolase (adenosine-forming)
MKAVAAGICDAALVDISHDVPAQSVRGGAYFLWSAAPMFPAGTVHCAVVDPGVGTSRAALAVVSGGHTFVGPDNGLLLPAAYRTGAPSIYRLANPAYWRTPVSATFHGRDVFAPSAAHLAAGVPLQEMAAPAGAFVDFRFPVGRCEGRTLTGEVVWVDPFGNIITSIPGSLLDAVPTGRRLVLEAQSGSLPAARGSTFADVAPDEMVVLTGSDGLVEAAVRGGSAAAIIGASPGDSIRIHPA